MFERFTDRARRVVVLAQEEARLQNHNYIGTEHVLLGLIHEGESAAAQALAEVGVELKVVRAKVVEVVGEGAIPASGHIPFTPRAKQVLEIALREALQLAHNYLGPEHLLLALVGTRGSVAEGVAVQVLVALGHDPARVRATVLRRVEQYDRENPRISEASPATWWPNTPGGPSPELWRRVEQAKAALDGVWMVFNGDGSMARPFPTEIEALRYAVTMSGSQVELTRWGQDVGRPEKAS